MILTKPRNTIDVRKSRVQGGGRKPPTAAPASNAQTLTLAAPTRGLLEGAALSEQDGLIRATNVFPTTRGVRVRGGSYKVATIGDPVVSAFVFRSASTEKLFAASDTDIYDVSALNPASVPTADVTGQTSGLYSVAMMGAATTQYLYAVNGDDEAQLYDGSSWTAINGASSPAITGVTTSDLRYVWLHKNRLWFIEKGTRTAWYLPVDSIGGAAADFSLDGVFKLGGNLLFGATWSQDSGDGMDDRVVFVSDQGEVAVYAGTNPASAAEWAIVGVYKMPPPLGQDAHIKAGGDLIFATEGGLIPLSAVMAKDPGILELSAISRPIQPSWSAQMRAYQPATPWQVVKWPREEMVAVIMPTSQSELFVVNSATGGWGKYTGWDAQCATIFGRQLYFGATDGFIYQCERGGSDDGAPYTASWAYSPQYLGVGAVTKVVNGLRATFAAVNEFTPQLSMSTNYIVDFPAVPDAADDPVAASAVWDVGLWDVATWDSASLSPVEAPVTTTGWVSQGKVGETIIPQFQITSDSENRPNIEFLSADVLFETGAPVG